MNLKPESIAEQLKPLVEMIVAEKAKGDSPFSYKVLFQVISRLMKITEGLEGINGEQKKKFVIDAGIWVYEKFDPDLSLTEEKGESIESFTIKNLWPNAIEFAIEFWKEEKK